MLSADAFSKFEEDGVLNAETGRAFREAILARGGSQAPMVLFVDFAGVRRRLTHSCATAA